MHTDDMNDAVLCGIAEDIAAGRCWACGCERDMPHVIHCPEAEPPKPAAPHPR